MRKHKMKPIQTYRPVVVKNNEGTPVTTYELNKKIYAEIWPASGKVQAEMYGLKLAYIMNMITDKRNILNENDGVDILGSNHADHKVISKKVYTQHVVYELERILL